MATYTQRGKKTRVQIRIHGIIESATFPSRMMAREWAAEREAEIVAGVRGMVVRGKTVKAMLEKYKAEVCPTHKGERWEKIRLDLILREWGIPSRHVDKVSPADVGELRDKRLLAVSGASVRRELSLLASVFETARKEWRWCQVNPVHDVKLPKDGKPRTKIINRAEYRAMLKVMQYRPGQIPQTKTQWVGAAWCLAIRTGMRAGEIMGLTWDHVDLESWVATLPETKNGTRREVPLFPRALRIMGVIPRPPEVKNSPVFPLTSASLDTLFRKARVRSRCDGITFHDSRHLFCTMLANSGRVNPLQLARVLGHQDLKMTLRYFSQSATSIAHSNVRPRNAVLD